MSCFYFVAVCLVFYIFITKIQPQILYQLSKSLVKKFSPFPLMKSGTLHFILSKSLPQSRPGAAWTVPAVLQVSPVPLVLGPQFSGTHVLLFLVLLWLWWSIPFTASCLRKSAWEIKFWEPVCLHVLYSALTREWKFGCHFAPLPSSFQCWRLKPFWFFFLFIDT